MIAAGSGGGGTAGKSKNSTQLNFQRHVPKFLQPYAHMLGQKKQDEEEPMILEQQKLRAEQEDDEEEDKAAEEAGVGGASIWTLRVAARHHFSYSTIVCSLAAIPPIVAAN